MTTQAQAGTVTVTVNRDGTFVPNVVVIDRGDTVRWIGPGGPLGGVLPLDRVDAIAQVGLPGAGTTGAEICQQGGAGAALARPFDPTGVDPTGPERHGVSGVWALGPEGGKVSEIEIPSATATALGVDGAPVAGDKCAQLDYDVPGALETWRYRFHTSTRAVSAGSPATMQPDTVIGTDTRPHWLCEADVSRCGVAGCDPVSPSAADRRSIPRGTYLNGLMDSTYANPDVTGVVLRFNWKDLRYVSGGFVRPDWTDLDRELERAIAHGKLVTIDVRAGRWGTPAWIFDDYPAPALLWCNDAACASLAPLPFVPSVRRRVFYDRYDETPTANSCGSAIEIGSPAEQAYRDAYRGFIADLAAHIASNSRWWDALAHVKVSGANLQTSEAELPHHCDDAYRNTGNADGDPLTHVGADGVLDAFKRPTAVPGLPATEACECNPETWLAAGYTPDALYEYYAQVEEEIVGDFFGRKTMGYQIIQDGFPRANATTGRYWGDHLYREVEDGLATSWVNEAVPAHDRCVVPDATATFAPATGVRYCSDDHYALHLTPGTALPAEDPSGGAYPAGTEQAAQVLANARDGKFTTGVASAPVARQAGALFSPQHSGLQPLPNEQAALGYGNPGLYRCQLGDGTLQQRPRRAAPSPTMGGYVADFPIPTWHPGVDGAEGRGPCPNPWIVDAGRAQEVIARFEYPVLVWSPGPPIGPDPFACAELGILCDYVPGPGTWTVTYETVDVPIEYPPETTGYQTTNRVHLPEHVESALFDLAYNSNAVWIELYEDAIWRIGQTRGTGPLAQHLSSRVAGPGAACRFPTTSGFDTQLCYDKNLAQWAEELHWRRDRIDELWRTTQGRQYPALATPFPASYAYTFDNPTGSLLKIGYIDPARCDATRYAGLTAGPGQASSLGQVWIRK